MKRIIFLLLLVPSLLRSSFFEDDDLTNYQNVNVVTGHLSLNFLDAHIKGPVPYAIQRTYSSAGSLERISDNKHEKNFGKRKSGWLFQGGWNFLPHTNLLVNYQKETFEREDGSTIDICFKQVYGYEKSGGLIEYIDGHGNTLYPKLNSKKATNIDARRDPQNNRFEFLSDTRGILHKADGSTLYYKANKKPDNKYVAKGYWRLKLETLPSKHRVKYFYTKKSKNLIRIEIQNPAGDKLLGAVDLDHHSYKNEKILKGSTSDNQFFRYDLSTEFKEKNYLAKIQTSTKADECCYYSPGRKGTGAQLNCHELGGLNRFYTSYYQVGNIKEEKKYLKKPHRLPYKYDKVKELNLPDPKTGDPKLFAKFSYPGSRCTEIVDYEGARTKYTHKKKRLQKVEYFHPNKEKFSEIQLTWNDGYLASKTLLDKRGKIHFSKHFFYDDEKNIIEKRLKDHLTDTPESIQRFTYYPKNHLVKTEEIDGITCEYEYLKDTDLITKKLTLSGGNILFREFIYYDADNLVRAIITDDGSTKNKDDFSGVTERHYKRFHRDPRTGLCTEMVESYRNFETGKEERLLKHNYAYSNKNEIIQDRITYGKEQKSFTLYTEYDAKGHVTKKTTPTGRENTYKYDNLGNVIEAKEVGKEKRWIEYNYLNQPKKTTVGSKVFQSFYDQKGRQVKQIDENNNATIQVFDCFGRCIETHLPEMLDEEGQVYTPIIYTSYDIEGNPISVTNPRGETIKKKYNIFGKPTLITSPDNTQVQHSYHANGSLKKTTEADGTKIAYMYDALFRPIEKTNSQNGEVLAKESWTHNQLHPTSYTDPTGLTTYYKYNDKGQKIEERAEDRSIEFVYDALGNIEKTIQNENEKVQIFNEEGEVVQTWDADFFGKTENHTTYFYDSEGRKEKAHRMSSQGVAIDHFYYDSQGRLIQHLDPLGESSYFKYEKTINALNQTVNQKTTIDPVGNHTKDTFDANGHLILVQKYGPDFKPVAKEELFYDRAGNKAKHISTVYEDNTPIRTYTMTWNYNSRGWLLAETEENTKTTSYTYDKMGQLLSKTLPSGVTLHHTYDPLGRLLTQKSSDHLIDYSYIYDLGPSPIRATDHNRSLIWTRTHNAFNQLLSETAPNGAKLFWNYDNMGRPTKLTLPDQTTIEYEYEGLHMKTVTRNGYTHTYQAFDENGHVEKEDLIFNLGQINTTHDLLERPNTQTTPWHEASITFGPSGLVTKTENTFFGTKTYTHDPLNQLLKEGDKTHHFDSLGNPLNATVNHLNQITLTEKSKLTYNENGAPIRHHVNDEPFSYEYDPLNRLTTIHSPNKKHIQYIYDPFSRLYQKERYEYLNSKEWTRETHFYLSDQEKEICTYDDQKKIHTLKILGLGIKGEIGGAIAIEIENEIYAPLHDFNGNIIALIHQNGGIIEKHDIDAFGRVLLDTPSINPWRFQSKRTEEHLVFFGLRFYSPELGRWLTPDPIGPADSPNLYLYVHNSPMSRLDLFGLYSQDVQYIIKNLEGIQEIPDTYEVFPVYDGQEFSPSFLFCPVFHELNFSQEELETSRVNILDHFPQLFSEKGLNQKFQLYGNGIDTPREAMLDTMATMRQQHPEGTVILGLHEPSQGAGKDIYYAALETLGIDTDASIRDRQNLSVLSTTLKDANPDLTWRSVVHSRRGVTMKRAIAGLDKGENKIIKKRVQWDGIAPAAPMPEKFIPGSKNVYSDQDYFTGILGAIYQRPQVIYGGIVGGLLLPNSKKYNIEFKKSTATEEQKIWKRIDHGILGNTYKVELKGSR